MTEQSLKEELNRYLRVTLPVDAWNSKEVLDLKSFHLNVFEFHPQRKPETFHWICTTEECGVKVPVLARKEQQRWVFRVPACMAGIDIPDEQRLGYTSTATLEADPFVLLAAGAVL